MVMNYITRCDTEETEIEFTVQGRKVVGIFPTGDNSGIYQYLKRILALFAVYEIIYITRKLAVYLENFIADISICHLIPHIFSWEDRLI